jgi:hypothetical protein
MYNNIELALLDSENAVEHETPVHMDADSNIVNKQHLPLGIQSLSTYFVAIMYFAWMKLAIHDWEEGWQKRR